MMNKNLHVRKPFSDNYPSAMKDLSESLRLTLDHFSIVAITDVKGKIIYANDNFCTISKYNREELIGQDHRLINSGHHPKSFFKNLWSTISRGDIWHGEIKNLAKDGTYYWTDTHIIPQIDNDGRVSYFVAIRVDITARKKAEQENEIHRQQLLMADKMASLGILTTGVAHEINNPNHLIMSNTEILQSFWDDIMVLLDNHQSQHGDFELAGLPYSEARQQIPQVFSRIHGGAQRIRNIVDNLKKFAREEDPFTGRPVDVNAVVQGALVLVESMIKKSTDHFSLHLTDNLPSIFGNHQQLEQVVINLVTNACQSLTSKEARISISTRHEQLAGKVLLIVEDQGQGIEEAALKRIFDPFYTTKRNSGGTGLGLFVSYGIVKKHNAGLEFSSKVGAGTTATISIPVYAEPNENRTQP